MIPIKEMQEFMNALDIDMNEEKIKNMNAANEFYKFIESGRTSVVYRPNIKNTKKIPEHQVCSAQRKAVIHE